MTNIILILSLLVFSLGLTHACDCEEVADTNRVIKKCRLSVKQVVKCDNPRCTPDSCACICDDDACASKVTTEEYSKFTTDSKFFSDFLKAWKLIDGSQQSDLINKKQELSFESDKAYSFLKSNKIVDVEPRSESYINSLPKLPGKLKSYSDRINEISDINTRYKANLKNKKTVSLNPDKPPIIGFTPTDVEKILMRLRGFWAETFKTSSNKVQLNPNNILLSTVVTKQICLLNRLIKNSVDSTTDYNTNLLKLTWFLPTLEFINSDNFMIGMLDTIEKFV